MDRLLLLRRCYYLKRHNLKRNFAVVTTKAGVFFGPLSANEQMNNGYLAQFEGSGRL
jgi:hypothetical protein